MEIIALFKRASVLHTLTPIAASKIYTGNAFKLSVPISYEGSALTNPELDVRAAIISPYFDGNLSGNIQLSFNSTSQEWEGTFTGQQTRQLLNDPLDLTSGVLYSKPVIEVEVIPLAHTIHYTASAAPSLIADEPSTPPPPNTHYITSEEFDAHVLDQNPGGHVPIDGLPLSSVQGLLEELAGLLTNADDLRSMIMSQSETIATQSAQVDALIAQITTQSETIAELQQRVSDLEAGNPPDPDPTIEMWSAEPDTTLAGEEGEEWIA